MGLADTVTKAYMKDNSVFADAFNYLIYGGEAVVDPKQLQELDTTEIALPAISATCLPYWILRRLHYRLDHRMKRESSQKKQFRNTVMC